jgi:predicted metal-dependent peptidase
METYFDNQVKELYKNTNEMITAFLNANHKADNTKITIPNEFKEEFFRLVDKVNVSLMEDKDNFFGYFLFQMSREIRFDISSPTAMNFKKASYVIYFNPIFFLQLTINQMESTIKHEILHILSMHLIRAKEIKGIYTKAAVNMAMDIVVNTYLADLPPYATTLEWVNRNYSLKLLPFEPFEYYAEKLQIAIDLLATNKDAKIETDYHPETIHDIWEDSCDIDEKTLKEFTEKVINTSPKDTIPNYLESMLSSLKNNKGELPWNLYLKKLMGTVESNKKKTITRRDRRQPDRLDVRGQLRSHKAKIVVALDISGSISDEEFYQAISEVLIIVKNYNQEITIIECDSEIRRVYKVKSVKDIKDRGNISGATKFTPVFEYANNNSVNLLVYFTDGKGEDKLLSIPRGYKTLWVISGRGDKLSLQEAYGAVRKLGNFETKDNTLLMSDVIKDGYSMHMQERIHV